MNSKVKYTALYLFLMLFNVIFSQEKKEISKKEDSLTNKNAHKDTLKYEVDFNAEGEIRNDVKNKITYLLKNASVKYGDSMHVEKADSISINWNNGEIFAIGKPDSLNKKIIDKIIFTQGNRKYEYSSANFNFKTQIGLVNDVTTQEGEMIIHAEKSKKIENSYFLRRGLLTTDEYYKNKKDSLADYYLSFDKYKLIKDKNGNTIVGGPTQMYIEQVPTPLILPFVYVPSISKKRSAGILIGTFGERPSKGFYLDRWGFYIPFGEYVDYESRFGFYSKGSWIWDNRIRYAKIYRFSGDFNFVYEKNINSTKGLDDYSEGENYKIEWYHRQDPKASPLLNFNSSVSYSSQKYYTKTLSTSNIFNHRVNYSQSSSSISLTKMFYSTPLVISITSNATQDISTGIINMTLPNINVSYPQFYPFEPKTGPKTTLIHNIRMDYRMSMINNIRTNNEDIFTKRMFDNTNNGMTNQTSIGTSKTIFNYFQLNFDANYSENSTTKTIRKKYNFLQNQEEETTVNGFKSYRVFNTSVGLTTTLYGMLKFKKGSAVEALRHVLTPTISLNYSPDFSTKGWGFYDSYIDDRGNKIKYSFFENTPFGAPNSGKTGEIGINLDNNFEMKVRDSNEKTGLKKIKLLESMNISTAYNMASDSLKWGNINISASTNILQRFNLNYGMSIDPYKHNLDGQINEFSLSVANYTAGINFNIDPSLFNNSKSDSSNGLGSQDSNKKNDNYNTIGTIRNEVFKFDDENYAHFDSPWNVNVAIYHSYSKGFSQKSFRSTNMNIGGNFTPTPYWKINFSSNYDFDRKEIGFTTLGFERDVRSFIIKFDWVPISNSFSKTWNFFIGIKANVFKDVIKYESKNYNDGSSL